MNQFKRSVYVSEKCSLAAKDHTLIVVKNGQTLDIPFNEIGSIFIDTRADISMGSKVISKLVEFDISLVITDDKHKPSALIYSFKSNVLRAGRIYEQISWLEKRKELLWRKVLRNKIYNQEQCLIDNLLAEKGYLTSRTKDIAGDDVHNIEGIVAAQYFRTLFGDGFSRDDDNDTRNYALNYGYSILVSEIIKCVIDAGALTEIGFHHCNKANKYNLPYDIIEPFRPFVDNWVVRYASKDFTYKDKANMLTILDYEAVYGNQRMSIRNCIRSFTYDCLKYLKGANVVETISFVE